MNAAHPECAAAVRAGMLIVNVLLMLYAINTMRIVKLPEFLKLRLFQTPLSKPRLPKPLLLPVVVLFLFIPKGAWGTDYTWASSASSYADSWDTASNWTPSGTPGTDDTATIPSGRTLTLEIATSITTQASVINQGTIQFTISVGGNLINTGMITATSISVGGNLENSGILTSTSITVTGTTKISGGTLNIKDGTLQTGAFEDGAGSIESNGGTIYVTVMGGFYANSAQLNGTITLKVDKDNIDAKGNHAVSEITLINNGTGNISFATDVSDSLTVKGITAQGGVDIKNDTASGTLTVEPIISTEGTVRLKASAITIKNNITTTANEISLDGPVTLDANTTLTTNGGEVTFMSTVDGAKELTVAAGAGKVSFGGAVGGTTALGSLKVTSTNGADDAITIQNVTTSGAQTYTGKVALSADTTLTTTDAPIDLFVALVTGAGKSLMLNAGTGDVTLNTVGTSSARLGNLTIVSDGEISNNTSINTTLIYTITGVAITRASGGAWSIGDSGVASGTSEITPDFLQKISVIKADGTAGTVTIGDTNTTSITVDTEANLSSTDYNLTLVGSASAYITFKAALALNGRTLTIDTGGGVTSYDNQALVTAGTLSITKAKAIGNYSGTSTLYTAISTLTGEGLKTVAQTSYDSLIIDNTGNLSIGQIGTAFTPAYLVKIDAHSTITQTAPIYAHSAWFSATDGITLELDNNIANTSLTNGATSGDITFVNNYSKSTYPASFPDYSHVAAKNTASGGAIKITEKATDLALGNNFPTELSNGYGVTSNKGAITLNILGTGKALLLDNSTSNPAIAISTKETSGTGLAAVTIDSPVYATYGGSDTTRESLSLDGNITFGGAVGSTDYYLQNLTINSGTVSNATAATLTTAPALFIAANALALGANINTSASANKAITLKIDNSLSSGAGITINAGTTSGAAIPDQNSTISIAPITAGRTIEFGDANTLPPTIADVHYSSIWSNVTAAKFIIGDANTSTIYVSATGQNVAFSGKGVPYAVEFVNGTVSDPKDIEIRGNYKSENKELTLSPADNIVFNSAADITVDLGTASFEALKNVTLNSGGKNVSIIATGGISFGKVDTATPANARVVNITSSLDTNGLTLNAGSENILFNGTIGASGAEIGALTINDGNATPGSGAVDVTFNGAVYASGEVSINHTGTLTTAPGSASPVVPTAHITADGGFIQSGSAATDKINSIGGNITTTTATNNAAITLNRPITITNATGITLESGAGAISVLSSVTGAGKNFTVTAGTGSVRVGGDIGLSSGRLGAVSITGIGIILDGAGIWTASKDITLDAGTGTLTRRALNLTLDVTGTSTPTITLAAGTLAQITTGAGTLTLAGKAKLDVHNASGNSAIETNIAIDKAAEITLALTSGATGIIQATGYTLALEGDTSSGATLDLGEYDWLVGTAASSSDKGFYVYSGSSLTAHAASTLIMRGTGKTLNVNGRSLGNLTISRDTATSDTMVTLGAALTLQGNMTLKNGDGHALSAGSHSISVGGDWTQTSQSDFDPGTASVTFTGPSDKRTVTITGKTNWYDLVLTWANGINRVEFSNFAGGMPAGNGHKVQHRLLIAGGGPVNDEYPESTRLYITRSADNGTPPASEPTMVDSKWWVFEPAGSDVLDPACQNYDVRFSWAIATVGPIKVSRGHYTEPYYTNAPDPSEYYFSRYNVGWLLVNVFLYSFTEDSTGNGRIDRIRVQAAVGGISTGNPQAIFSGFVVEFEDDNYKVDTAARTGAYLGYQVCGNDDDMIYIWLEETDYPNTDARPKWRVKENKTLMTNAGEPIQMHDYTVPIDTAPPRISYTLAVPGDDKIYVKMSEPVDKAGANRMLYREFAGYTIVKVEDPNASTDGYTDAFLLTMGTKITAEDLVDGTVFPVDAFDGLVDRNSEENKIPPMVTGGVLPKFPKEYPPNDEPSFTYEYVQVNNTGGNLNPSSFKDLEGDFKTEIPNRFNAGEDYGYKNHKQRISDILVMVEPHPSLGLSDPHLSIWPLRMRDLSPANADSNGFTIGRVERYDGRGRLRPSQIETEFITGNGLGNRLNTLGLYFSSISSFDGFTIDAAAEGAISIPSVMAHMDKTVGAWLPPDLKDLTWAFDPGSTKNYADHSPKSSAKAIDYTDGPPMKEIVYASRSASGSLLYGLRLDTWVGERYEFPTKWWERESKPAGKHIYLKPFNFIALAARPQVGGVTILNNVIDPTKNEVTALNYELTRRGRVTISVFTLDGTMVRQLVRSVQEAGNHDASWDGLNQGGRPVARGMYFIRIVAPDIDEIRKVMVVK
jgi:hypothetical protein